MESEEDHAIVMCWFTYQ